MKTLIYRVELLTPALFGRVEGDPNSSVSYPYIPGSVIRAALLARFAQSAGVPLEQVLDHEQTAASVRRLFFGDVRFLNAYPAVPGVQSPERVLPTPRSWQQNKSQRARAKEGEEHKVPIFDLAVDQPEEDEPNQRVTAPFCWLGDPEEECDRVRLLSPRHRVAIHTQRATANRNFGRPRRGDGAVYRYDALDAGQAFIGAILCDDADERTLAPLLSGEFWIGKAHTAGYGRARFEYLRADPAWREVGGGLTSSQELIVTLLSPLLLRNQYGQFAVDAEHLARCLGEALDAAVKLERAFVGVEVVGGFNRKWGLPLPQAHAFAAGSVLVLKAEQVVPADKLQALEQSGLGERLNDGFGRLAFNWQQRAKLCIEPQPDPQGNRVALADLSSRQLAERIAQRLLDRRLEQLCLSRAAQLKVRPSPSRAQLNRLRSIALNALNDSDPAARLRRFLESATQRRTVREHWERSRLLELTSSQSVRRSNVRTFNQWIVEVIAKALDEQDPVAWAEMLGLARANEAVVKVWLGDVEVTPSLKQRRALTLRLLAEVLRRAAKASKSTDQAQGDEP